MADIESWLHVRLFVSVVMGIEDRKLNFGQYRGLHIRGVFCV